MESSVKKKIENNFEYQEKSNFDVKKKLILIKPGLSGIGSIFFRNEEDYLKNLEDPEEVYKKYIFKPWPSSVTNSRKLTACITHTITDNEIPKKKN